jgi:hypothetical protein
MATHLLMGITLAFWKPSNTSNDIYFGLQYNVKLKLLSLIILFKQEQAYKPRERSLLAFTHSMKTLGIALYGIYKWVVHEITKK